WTMWKGLEDMEDLNEAFREHGSSTPKGAINLGYVNRNWIELVATGESNYFGLDFDPGPKSVPGQDINFGRDEELKRVLAWSWGWFLNDLADELEQGNFRSGEDDDRPVLILRDPEPE